MTKPTPLPGQLVRVTYRLHSGQPWRDFLATVVQVLSPGAGPVPRKPGKRVRVRPLGGAGALGGWYSVNEVQIIGWDPGVLSPASHAVLDGLALSHDLNIFAPDSHPHTPREYPARMSQTVNWLARRGLVERCPASKGRVAATITKAGLETISAWELLGEVR